MSRLGMRLLGRPTPCVRPISLIPFRHTSIRSPSIQIISNRRILWPSASSYRSFSSISEQKTEVSNLPEKDPEATAQTVPEDIIPTMHESTAQTIPEETLTTTTEVIKEALIPNLETVVVPTITTASHAVGDGPSSFFLFVLGENILRNFHAFSGLPWWMVIALGTVATRLITAPVFVVQMRNQAVMTRVKKEMEAIVKSRPQQFDYTNKMATMAAQQELLKQRLQKNGFSYWKMFVPFFVSAPFFLTMFMGVRNLCYTEPSMKEGGFLIFQDLTTADPTYILPIVASLGSLLSIELSRYWNAVEMQPTMKMALRAFAILSVFIFTYMFKGVLVTVLFSGLMTMLQNYVLSRPKVKQLLGLPLNDKEKLAAGIAVAPTVLYSNKPKKKSTPSA
eukprot:TRINITY_DN8283_c0_g1_i1.p1 TRINITY_DN8283_c0_g1~~TRINITY_DN8283_c0_g1_i1.p1  ORF type:complete len:393 (+),score=79.37 TRINITY_DN8283_c0_g1_i1:59-1237(+)